MGRPVNMHNTIVKSVHVARIQNTEQQRDETQRRQFALALQQEAASKRTQVQDSHKAEAPEIHRRSENKEKRQKRRKRSYKEPVDGKQDSENEEHHIDLKAD